MAISAKKKKIPLGHVWWKYVRWNVQRISSTHFTGTVSMIKLLLFWL